MHFENFVQNGDEFSQGRFTKVDGIKSQHGLVITLIKKFGIKLIIYSQTSPLRSLMLEMNK